MTKKHNASGGLAGFFKGTQGLGAAFWLLGVVPALLITGFVLILSESGVDFAVVFPIELGLLLITRPAAWIAIIRCIQNTSHGAWSVAAGLVVAADILHKLFFFIVTGALYAGSLTGDKSESLAPDLCRQQLVLESGLAAEEVSVLRSLQYRPDIQPYYPAWYIDENNVYRSFACRIENGEAVLSPIER